MSVDLRDALHGCVRQMLRPLIRFCLRFSLNIQDLVELTKHVFVEVAAEEMERAGKDVNVSRLSVATGMHRRDVMRIFRSGETKQGSHGLIRKIIGQWQADRRFATKAGKPAVLTIEGEDSDFRKLVRSVSMDINPGTVLFELERLGAIERVRGGIKLLASAYVPKENPLEGYRMMSSDCEDLMCAVQENVLGTIDLPNLHAKTEYDNIPADSLPEIREWLLYEGSQFHEKVRKYLSSFDRDITPRRKEGGSKAGGNAVRVALGTFSRAEEMKGGRS